MNKKELKLKASTILYVLLEFNGVLLKNIFKIKELPKEILDSKVEVQVTIASTNLFFAQQFFWENFIQDEKEALLFEKELYSIFGRVLFDPSQNIKDITDYINNDKKDKTRIIKYLGWKICSDAKFESAIMMMKITVPFATMLEKGFYEALKKGWELPIEEHERLAKNFE